MSGRRLLGLLLVVLGTVVAFATYIFGSMLLAPQDTGNAAGLDGYLVELILMAALSVGMLLGGFSMIRDAPDD